MNKELEQIERRTIRYWFEDGIYEMAFGLFLLLLGLVLVGLALAPEKSVLQFVLSAAILPVLLLGGWLMKKMVRGLKQKLTYPRTGYISYRGPEPKKRRRRAWLIGALGGIVGAMWGGLLASERPGFNWMPGLMGLAFALVNGFLALRSGLARSAVLAAFSAAAGIFLSLSGWPKMMGLAAFYLLLGMAKAISGSLSFLLYLRRNPLPDKGSR